MIKPTLLFADNDADFLATRTEFLEQEGYQVKTATNPTEARHILENETIDLAILDIRLINDDDDKDTSGLIIAKEAAPSVPKIILTGFPSVDYVRETLRSGWNDQTAAFDFLAKKEGAEVMLSSIRELLKTHVEKHIKATLDIPKLLKLNIEEAQRQVILNHRAWLGLSGTGAAITLVGAIGVLVGYVPSGTLSVLSGIITEGIAWLFWKFSRDANRRSDQYYQDLLKLYKEQQLRNKK